MKSFLQSVIQYSWEAGQLKFLHGVWSDRQWRAYRKVWHWIQFRYSSEIQEEFYKKYGAVKLYEKINKTRQAFGLKPI